MEPQESRSRAALPAAEQRRRRREWSTAALVALVLLLGFVFERAVIARARALPLGGEAVFFAMVHLNVVGIGVLALLLARNITKLVTDRRSGRIGSRLSLKFVLSLVLTTAIPTAALFAFSAFLVTHTLQTWFRLQLSEGLRDSLAIADLYDRGARASALGLAERTAAELERRALLNAPGALEQYLREQRDAHALVGLEVRDLAGARIAAVGEAAPADAALVRRGLAGERAAVAEPPGAEDDGRALLYAVAPVPLAPSDPRVVGALVIAQRAAPAGVALRAERIRGMLAAYLRMQPGQGPLEASTVLLLGMLSLVSLLFSTWMGFRLAKHVADPIQRLALATHDISAGNLDVRVEQGGEDEIGLLVAAFNRMASELKSSRNDLEQRRALMEIILGSVGAGVISLDREACVTTVNSSALRLVGLAPAPWPGRKLGELVRGPALQTLEELLRQLASGERERVQRQLPLAVAGEQRILNWTVSQLQGSAGERAGAVIVIDDVTQIVKGERMEAWRDVARRIAHEIKNPLTPIQLSAQRLRRKLEEPLGEDARAQSVLRECTDAITGQVDAMKLLLAEFSNFARLPATDPVRTDLNKLVEDAVALYKGKPELALRTELAPDLPELDIDREQIKRVLLNLIDNAIAAIDAAGPGPRELWVASRLDRAMGTAQLEVADTGCGIRPADRARIFQPGFSTKANGTGIGLAIVSRIVSDHSGTIRVRPNEPRGTRFLIELPARI